MSTNNKKYRNIGAATVFIFFSLLFFVLIVRFITIQYTGEAEGRVLSAKAAQLYKREAVIKATRGSIFDRNGEVIAEDSASYTLIAVLDEELTTDPEHPRHVVDPQETAAELSQLINMEESEIYQTLTKEGRKQVEFGAAGRNLSHSVKKKIEQLALPGISFIKDTKRFYPNGVFASHLIGYAQAEQDGDQPTEIVGKLGLEKSFNNILAGKDGSIQYESDIWNYILPNSKKHIKEPEDGNDIYLTIDKKIQTFLEDAMTKVDEKYKPESIMAIVADPKTGKILAMGQRPTFHPETRVGIEKTWLNELIEDSFEPGSTMKVFSLAAAVDQGVYNPDDYYPSGIYQINSQDRIRDHNKGSGWGSITFSEGVRRSSNVAFAYLLEKMGTDTWKDYLDKFKFGQKTGIDLPNEVTGKILYNRQSEKVTSVFGQGTTVTAMQMIQGMTAIANDGKMMQPYVVDKIINSNTGDIKETSPKVAGTPISEKTAKEVREILETVITGEHGTGAIYQLDGYNSAGKTGTAQISNPNGGGYLEGRNNYIFSYIGLAPAEDPELVMYVAVKQPQLPDDEAGNVPVSAIYNTVMKSSLQYLNIEPEEVPEKEIITIKNYIGSKTSKVIKDSKNSKLNHIILGKGKEIEAQLPEEKTEMIEGGKVLLKTSGDLIIPNFIGWSKREVLNAAQLMKIKVDVSGDGYATEQSLAPNTVIQQGETIKVTFTEPSALEHPSDELENTEGESE